MFVECNFCSQVESRGRVIQHIRLDGNHLRPGTESATQTDKDKIDSLHRLFIDLHHELKNKDM